MSHPLARTRYIGYLAVFVAGVLLWAVSLRGLFNIGDSKLLEWCCLAFGLGLMVWQGLRFAKTVRRDISRFVVLKSETGTVKVHARAVEEALRRTAKTLPEVSDVRVRLVIDQKTGLPNRAAVDARIRDITSIFSAHDSLSRVLAERYGQIIPSAPDIHFDLTIKHHERPPSKKKRADNKRVVPPEEDETKSIRAPQYPVPDE